MADTSRGSSRPRPAPLANSNPSDRAHLLSSLRTARPFVTTPQTATFSQPGNAATASSFSLEQANYQSAYLALQQQILIQQSQLILARQQEEAEAAMRAMRRRSGAPVDGGFGGGGGGLRQSGLGGLGGVGRVGGRQDAPPQSRRLSAQFITTEDEESVRSNPLPASALARRKRQSMMEFPTPALQAEPSVRELGRGSPGPVAPSHHRRTSSSSASAFSHHSFDLERTSSPAKSLRGSPKSTEPPSLVLSKPGEAYPGTSESDDDGRASKSEAVLTKGARRYSVQTRQSSLSSTTSSASATSSPPRPSSRGQTESGSSTASSENGTSQGSPPLRRAALHAAATTNTSETFPPAEARRPSQAGSLAAALSGRRQRPASIGVPSNSLSANSLGTAQQRSVSDASALSPFATTFQPLPISPYTPSASSNDRHVRTPSPSGRIPAAPGTSVAIRQPRGPAPEAELSSSNFATRLRKRAIALLSLSNRGGRLSMGGANGGGPE